MARIGTLVVIALILGACGRPASARVWLQSARETKPAG